MPWRASSSDPAGRRPRSRHRRRRSRPPGREAPGAGVRTGEPHERPAFACGRNRAHEHLVARLAGLNPDGDRVAVGVACDLRATDVEAAVEKAPPGEGGAGGRRAKRHESGARRQDGDSPPSPRAIPPLVGFPSSPPVLAEILFRGLSTYVPTSRPYARRWRSQGPGQPVAVQPLWPRSAWILLRMANDTPARYCG